MKLPETTISLASQLRMHQKWTNKATEKNPGTWREKCFYDFDSPILSMRGLRQVASRWATLKLRRRICSVWAFLYLCGGVQRPTSHYRGYLLAFLPIARGLLPASSQKDNNMIFGAVSSGPDSSAWSYTNLRVRGRWWGLARRWIIRHCRPLLRLQPHPTIKAGSLIWASLKHLTDTEPPWPKSQALIQT